MAQLTDVYGQAIEAAASGKQVGQGRARQGAGGRHRDPEELTSRDERNASEGEDVGGSDRGGLGRADAEPGGVPAGRRPLPPAAQQPAPTSSSFRTSSPSSRSSSSRSSGRSGSASTRAGSSTRRSSSGFQNWREIARRHASSPTSIKNTAIYVVEAIFLVFTLALLLALLLNRYRKGSNFFKLALYVPLLAPAVLVGLDLAVRHELRLRALQPDPHQPRHRRGSTSSATARTRC